MNQPPYYEEDEKESSETLLGDAALKLPSSVDWRQQGAVTRIKDQGKCSGCYGFSSAGAMEGAYAIKTGKLQDFSAAQLIDCTGNYGNHGCSGGYMTNCFNYLQSAKI